MCVSLISFDFKSAFGYNPTVTCLIPVLLSVWGVWAVRYIKTGKRDLLSWQRMTAIAIAAILIIFGILRNIPAVVELLPWFVP